MWGRTGRQRTGDLLANARSCTLARRGMRTLGTRRHPALKLGIEEAVGPALHAIDLNMDAVSVEDGVFWQESSFRVMLRFDVRGRERWCEIIYRSTGAFEETVALKEGVGGWWLRRGKRG